MFKIKCKTTGETFDHFIYKIGGWLTYEHCPCCKVTLNSENHNEFWKNHIEYEINDSEEIEDIFSDVIFERLKKRCESTEFTEVPVNIKATKDFIEWLNNETKENNRK